MVEVLDAIAEVGEAPAHSAAAIGTTAKSGLAQRNLFGEPERIAARAASAGTRRQYLAIVR